MKAMKEYYTILITFSYLREFVLATQLRGLWANGTETYVRR